MGREFYELNQGAKDKCEKLKCGFDPKNNWQRWEMNKEGEGIRRWGVGLIVTEWQRQRFYDEKKDEMMEKEHMMR